MRPVAPHPRLLLYKTFDVKATHTIFSNVPTFVLGSPDDCGIVKLTPFDFSNISKRRKKRIFIPVVERLNIYYRLFK